MSSDIKLVDGDGGYSCVIQPPVDDIVKKYVKRYIEYTDRNSDDIGKLFTTRRDFETELKLLRGVNEIDDKGSFTVKLKGANLFDIDMLNDDIIECLDEKGLDKDETNIYQIILEYGGKNISNVSKYSIPFKKFIKLIKPLLKGISKLHSMKLIHQDIKPSNMLLNNDKISLIDFGISEFADKLYSEQNKKRLSHEYKYHPPEYYLAYLLIDYKNSRSSFQTKLETVIDDLIDDSYLYEVFDNSKIERVTDALSDFVKQIREDESSYNEVFNEEMAYKCDVYSLSFIFKEFHKKLVFDNQNQKDFFQTLHDMCSEINPYKRSTLEKLINFVEESEQLMSNIKDDQSGGGKTRRLRLKNMHENLSDDKSQDPPLKYKLPQIVNKHLKKR